MVDELCGPLASPFAHGFEDARLGHAAEIVIDSRRPADLHHVEPNRTGQPIGLTEAAFEAVLRDAGAAIAVDLLEQRVDAVAEAMGEQCQPAGLVQYVEPLAKRLIFLRDVGPTSPLPLADSIGGRTAECR